MNIFARELVQLLKEHGKELSNLFGRHTETHQIFPHKVTRLKQSLEDSIDTPLG
jgi:hypothetical protein